MSSIKCPGCGIRIILPTDEKECTNCGAPIVQQIADAEQLMKAELEAEQDLLENPFALPEEEKQLTPALESGNETVPSRDSAAPFSESEQQSNAEFFRGDTDKMHVIRIQKFDRPEDRMLEVRRQAEQENASSQSQPYMPRMLATIDPRGALAEPFASNNVGTDVAIPLSPSTALPRGFPRRPPDVVGTIVQVQSQVENQLTPDSTASVIRMLRELVWSVPNDSQSIVPRQVYATTLRVAAANGQKKDARLEGYMRGVSLSLGDTVSLWGRKRHGLLLIYRGYNHTTEGKIKTTATSSFFFGLMLMIAILILLYLFLSYSNVHILPSL